MRGAAALAFAISAALLVPGPASAQTNPNSAPPLVAPTPAPTLAPSRAPAPAAVSPMAPPPAAMRAVAAPPPQRAPTLTPAQAPAAAPIVAASRAVAFSPPMPKCEHPGALGVARTVEIDTTGGPGFGFEHFKQHDFLQDKEVVLTFDDGPWVTTPAVLKALANECVKATFFSIGKHSTYYPEILRQVAKAGHTVGSHTWSHTDLAKKTPEEAKEEIEKAISAVNWALEGEGQEAPFFRFPALSHPPEMVTYLGERNIAIFSTDIDSFDFKTTKPEVVIKSIMTKLQKRGKGIILMHDFRHATSQAIPQLLAQLKAGGYKVVHMRPAVAVTTMPQYDEEFLKDQKLPTVNQRPTSSIVKTVE